MPEKKHFTVQEVPPQCPLPYCATRDDIAPLFETDGYYNGESKTFNLSNYSGKWVILFFYSSDFTFV
ncbi:peroxiredoxin [Ammoniphilus resinae]|nr:peroxiredoxin [Ammoniphilus resinae]